MSVLASSQVWWHVARSSGIVAWALTAAAVLWGLFLATRVLGPNPRAPWLLDLHRFLGGLSVVFVAVHLVGLWADSYVAFGWRELFVPFASSWRPVAVAWGVVALWLLVAVEVTSLLMKRLPRRVWRWVHLSSYALFVFATVHLFSAGTDATNGPVRVAAWVAVVAVLFASLYRWIGPGRAASARPARPASEPQMARSRPSQ